MANETEVFKPYDYVYLGQRRASTKGKKVVILGLLHKDCIFREFVLSHTKEWKYKAVGGVYTGATFSDGAAKGAQSATFVKLFDDKEKIVRAKLEEEMHLRDLASEALEAKAAKINHIEETLLPLRKIYASIFSLAEARAFEDAVLRALRKKP